MQASNFGHVDVITDGQWMESYDSIFASPQEKSQAYKSSADLDEMWFEVALQNEHIICAVNIYTRSGNYTWIS